MAKARKTGRSKPKARAKSSTRAKPAKAAKPARPAKSAKPAASYAERFDRHAYEVPVIDLREAIALATSLLAARPAKAPPAVAEEAKRVTVARDRARVVEKAQAGQAASVDARAHDVAMDRAWATFVRRIQDHVELSAARRADVADAADAADAADVATIYAIVRDLSILKLNYLAEFAQIGARLDALKREGLLDVAAALAGATFLGEVLRCHGEYGQALGVMTPAADAKSTPVDRGEARLALIEAVDEYAVQVMAQARAGRHESWAVVRKALEPIAALRARHGRALRMPPAPPPAPAHPPAPRAASPS